jgi:hypothetical protein
MEELEEYKKMLVGKTLTNLFFTKQDGPYDYMPGIFPAYYFFTIMELDNEKKFRFSNDYITEWENDEPIITLDNQNWDLPKNIVFKGQKIVELTKDEYQQITIHLENATTIKHTIDYGDQLFIENENIKIIEEDIDKQLIWTYIKLPKTEKKWWQKLWGME